MSGTLGPVEIGAREIYDELVRLRATVDRVVAQHEEGRRELGDHESRIRSLERGRWPLPALSTAIALAALIITVLPILTGGPRH